VNLRSSLDQRFGKLGLEAAYTLGLSSQGSEKDIKIQNNNYEQFHRDDSLTTFKTFKKSPNQKDDTISEVSQDVFKTLNSVRHKASRMNRNKRNSKTVHSHIEDEELIPKYKLLKSIEEQMEFNSKLKKMKKETNVAKSLNGYPKGIFL
jgi:CRISPR/Cas system CMR subunit Cmr4 (Cas7 group RAMP superfamily)